MPPAPSKNVDVHIHLSNGDVVDMTTDEWAKAVADVGSPSVYRKNGIEHPVIGVYSAAVQYEENEK